MTIDSNRLESLSSQLVAARGGDRVALARLISIVERSAGRDVTMEAMLRLHPGESYTVGITGAPGAGKSTLLNMLLSEAVSEQRRTAVLAIDPSSPLSQGAMLGDRLRMPRLAGNDNVYMRSMASRGMLGGMAAAVHQTMRILASAGWPWVVVETIGAGQTEVDIAATADTVIVVLTPGAGDEIQAFKAGLMEIADIFLINKADLPGAQKTRNDVLGMLTTLQGRRWIPPVVDTVALKDIGGGAVWQAIDAHRAFLEVNGLLQSKRRERTEIELMSLARRNFDARLKQARQVPATQSLVDDVLAGRLDIQTAAAQLSEEAARVQFAAAKD